MAGISNVIYQHVSPRSIERSQLLFSSLTVFLSVYRTLIRRNAVFLTTIFASAFAFELTFDTASNKIWDTWNQGRQWKDIKYRYMNKDEEDEE